MFGELFLLVLVVLVEIIFAFAVEFMVLSEVVVLLRLFVVILTVGISGSNSSILRNAVSSSF